MNPPASWRAPCSRQATEAGRGARMLRPDQLSLMTTRGGGTQRWLAWPLAMPARRRIIARIVRDASPSADACEWGSRPGSKWMMLDDDAGPCLVAGLQQQAKSRWACLGWAPSCCGHVPCMLALSGCGHVARPHTTCRHWFGHRKGGCRRGRTSFKLRDVQLLSLGRAAPTLHVCMCA